MCKNQYGKFIFWDFIPYEMYFKYKEDLLIIKSWYNVQGITSDWQGGLVKAVKEVFPDIPHQRCLVHTQRRCESLLTQNPKTQAGVDLLKIVKRLNRIKTIGESKKWFYRIYAWGFKYEGLINQRTYDTKEDGSKTWWYTHKKLRGSYRTIITSRNNLFLYLSDKNLSKDTNGLEVEFKHLKNKIRKHTALTKRRKVCLMFWYLYLKNLQRN